MRNTNCFKELAGCPGWQAQLSALISGPEGAGSTPPACWRTPDRAGMQAAHHLHAPARHQVCGPDGPALPSLLPAHTCPLSSHCMCCFRGGAQTSAAPEPAFVPPAARRCCGQLVPAPDSLWGHQAQQGQFGASSKVTYSCSTLLTHSPGW